MDKKKRLVIGIIGVATLLVVLGTTVAYFLINVDNNNKEVLEVNTGSLSLIFDDNNDGMQVKSLMLGESVSKELKIENNGTLPVTTNLNWYDLTNTYLTKSLFYKLEYKTTEDGTWTPVETVVGNNVPRNLDESEITIAKNITIPEGTTYYYRLTITLESLDNINQSGEVNSYLSTRFSIGDLKDNTKFNAPDAVALMLSNETPIGVNTTEPDFALSATTDEGVYAMEDDYGTSYYYRGAVTNNYVKFGGFYWRIIRINGNGSLRMIYDGQQAYANGVNNKLRYAVTGVPYNPSQSDAKYVGYMYGPSGSATSTSAKEAQTNLVDSNAKKVVENWYANNIKVNVANDNKDLTTYLDDIIFCNDRSLPPVGTIWRYDQDANYANLGWVRHVTAYGSTPRFIDANNTSMITPKPTFICPDNNTVSLENDKFTVSKDSGGNGSLTYPVGLITADEIATAGCGKAYTANKSYYLYKSSNYGWSMTPRYVQSDGAGVWQVYSSGQLSSYANLYSTSGAIAPVINLKAEYAVSLNGRGTMTEPYNLPGVE